jgi:protein-L-isoaspartate(D-aspartate) O-methyltransferase
MEEDFKYIARRRELIEELEKKGIRDKITLKAIGKVPRQYFIDETFLHFAYHVDKAIQIGMGQTISQPYTVALQTELLAVKPTEKVLEIGTGSGYQAAVLVECGVELYSIERQRTLFETTHKKLDLLGYSVHCFFGDGFEGLPEKAPFDKIIITAGASEIPEKLLRQLKTGGVMVVPLGEGNKQQMYRIVKISETDFEKKNFGNCAFVPMLSGIN